MTTDFIWFISTASILIIVLICLLSPNVCMWIHKKHFMWKVISKQPISIQDEINFPYKKSDFTIEHYPLTQRYYPKYKNSYLKKNYITGIVGLNSSMFFAYADYFSNEKEALELIDLYKEHQFKKNVEIIITNK